MASPAPAPGFVPVYRRRSVVGPIILILIGIVFLMRNFGHALPMLHIFLNYWPVLLIGIGVVRLAEYGYSRYSGVPTPRMGGGSVLVIVLLLIFGASAASLRSRTDINWGNLRDTVDIDDDFLHLFGSEYAFDGEMQQSITPEATLRVNSDRGNITINPTDDNNVRVTYHKRVFASSQSEADSTNQGTAPKITTEGNVIVVSANTEASGPKGVATDLEIFVPAKVAADLTSRRGDISVMQRQGDVKVNSTRGDVTLESVKANTINISMRKGSLHGSNIEGNVIVDGRLDDMTMDTVNGSLFATADIFGDIRLSKVQKGVTFRSSRTDLEFAKLNGDLSMDRGDLQASGLVGPLSLSTRAKDVDLRDFTGDVKITNDRGDISLEGASQGSLGNIEVVTHHGDVHLRLPDHASFQYQATTRHGDIESDFGEIKSTSEGGSSNANGTIGKGGARVNITSDTGDIDLRKLEAGGPTPPPTVNPAVPKPPKPPKSGKVPKSVEDTEVM